MKLKQLHVTLGTLGIVTLACVALSQAPTRSVDPEAGAVLSLMSDHLAEEKAVAFTLVDTIDDVEPDGRKLQYSHVRAVTMVRPDKIRIHVRGDVMNRTLWKDGETITVLDHQEGVYAVLPDPGTIDQAIHMLHSDYGFSIPAADLLMNDMREALLKECYAVEYIGTGLAGETECHHLAFRGEVVDYQLWVEAGEEPAPRKMVITYKLVPGEPQYSLEVLERSSLGPADQNAFKAVIPQDAREIEFHPLDAANGGE